MLERAAFASSFAAYSRAYRAILASPATGLIPALSSVRTTTRPSFFAGQSVPVDVLAFSRCSALSISTTEIEERPSSWMRATVLDACRPLDCVAIELSGVPSGVAAAGVAGAGVHGVAAARARPSVGVAEVGVARSRPPLPAARPRGVSTNGDDAAAAPDGLAPSSQARLLRCGTPVRGRLPIGGLSGGLSGGAL